ncbi:MAG: GTPase [Phycisphaeraceae bacterium]
MTPVGDTIAAIASPLGHAPRGLLRLSGPNSHTIIQSITDSTPTQPHQLSPTRLAPPLPPIPCLTAIFQAPHSYTGEDAAELWLPGHPSLLDRVLTAALNAGARLAEPGAFTFRAFRAGRITLDQAEGVAALIAASSDDQRRAAQAWLQGDLAKTTTAWMNTLADLLALIEAGIDFTDQEDVVPIPTPDLIHRLAETRDAIASLRQSSRAMAERSGLPRVVLAGPPSAGKSTLLNALLAENRAIIHHHPGTTRDRLEATLTLTASDRRTIDLTLIDLAGLDHTDTSSLAAEAQRIARIALDDADLILRCTPADQPTPIHLSSNTPILDLITKADLLTPPPTTQDSLPISTHTNLNLDTLRHQIADRLLSTQRPTLGSSSLALNPRHINALQTTEQALAAALDHLDSEPEIGPLAEPEVIAASLRSALDALGTIAGRIAEDDIIGRVFATFCVGK